MDRHSWWRLYKTTRLGDQSVKFAANAYCNTIRPSTDDPWVLQTTLPHSKVSGTNCELQHIVMASDAELAQPSQSELHTHR